MSLRKAQIYITQEQNERLKHESLRRRITVSQLIRLAIDYFLQTNNNHVNWDDDPLTQTIGKVKLKGDKTSDNHNHCLYGHKKGVKRDEKNTI